MASSFIKIAGIYQNLSPICDFVTDWAEKAGLAERSRHAVQMAVDEACSNIIEHAYNGEGNGEITITCHLLDSGLKVTIEDHGKPFDPALVKEPDIQAPLEERNNGGLGLFLMRQLMDEVTFHFGKDGNTLVLVKRQDPI